MLATPARLAVAALAVSSPAFAQDLYATDFTTDAGWTFVHTSGFPAYAWAVDGDPAIRCDGQSAALSAPSSLNFNDGVDIGSSGGATAGTATSPPIDLSAATSDVTLEFWVGIDSEAGCQWDRLRLVIRDAQSGFPHYSVCMSEQWTISCDWERFHVGLDRSWGVVRIEFEFDTVDYQANEGAGVFIDDLRVFEGCAAGWLLECVGRSHTTGVRHAGLEAVGSTSVTANTFALRGSTFPENSFAMAFYGPEAGAYIPIGQGVRCISQVGSFRLPIQSTGTTGRPLWSVDLTDPPAAAAQILPGATWFFQAIYRDGSSVNFSDAIRVTFCE